MKHIVKWIVPLLLAAVAAGCGTERRGTLEAYRSWPKGLSVSLTMPAEKLQQVKEAGFDYVEVTLNSLRGKSSEERLAAIGRFRADAEQAGLTVWSVHLPFGRAWDISSPNDSLRTAVVGQIAWFIDAVQVLKPRKMVLHPSAEPIADSLRAVHFENSVNSINTLAETARDTGSQLLIEDLPRTCLCNTSDEMLALFGRIDPSVGICFDTNHLLQETPEAFARAVGDRIASLHVSDYDAVDEKHWVMGKGVIDWPAVVEAIASTGYDGVFMFEVGDYDSFEQVADTWRAVERRLEEIENRK